MKTHKAKDIISERYGAEGSEERKKFREEAYSYYFGENQNRRKELKMGKMLEIL